MELTQENLEKFLSSLGDTVTSIVNYFKTNGIKGNPIRSHECSVTEAIVKEFSVDRKKYQVASTYKKIEIRSRERDKDEKHSRLYVISTPKVIQDFMHNYDIEEYPELIKTVEDLLEKHNKEEYILKELAKAEPDKEVENVLPEPSKTD